MVTHEEFTYIPYVLVVVIYLYSMDNGWGHVATR